MITTPWLNTESYYFHYHFAWLTIGISSNMNLKHCMTVSSDECVLITEAIYKSE